MVMARRGSQAPWLAAGAGLAALCAGAASLLWAPLPRLSGRLSLPGLAHEVEVIRDRWGVPHIYATTNADLFMAQGFIHAQDRLWQMELNRRIGLGRLAEIFGHRALEADRFLRVFGFNRVVAREYDLLSDDTRAAIDAYVAGVNAFLRQTGWRLPLEFRVLRFRPDPWQPVDALAFSKVMALGLCENWTVELLRARIIAALGPHGAGRLDSGYPEGHPLTIPAAERYGTRMGDDALRASAQVDSFAGGTAAGGGSNAWVAAGSRTVSGKPLLANDPHLAIQMPSIWYENHLVGGDLNVTGASIPGAPGVVIGHNERIAWGVTNGMTDVQDLYIETFDPADPTRYRAGGRWEQATVVRESITVRGRADPFVEPVMVTRHGPVITPLLGSESARDDGRAGGDQPLALRWTALSPVRLAQSVLAINRARDWESFRAALADWGAPAQNFVYADVDGHIGYALGGDAPIRRSGDGRVPMPGEGDDYEWTGIVPHHEMPHVLDPGVGYVVTANNRIAADGYPHALPSEWLPGYRAARIGSLLEATARHDVASFGRIHSDRLCLPGLQVAALAARLAPSDAVEERALSILRSWDGSLTAESCAGSIYARFVDALSRAAAADLAATFAAVAHLGAMSSPPEAMYLARALPRILEAAARDDDSALPDGQTWGDVLQRAWSTAIASLRRELGSDVATWRYGRIHKATLRHPLGVVPLLGSLLNRGPFPVGGDINTVCMGFITTSPGRPPAFTAPSYRQICDLSDWDSSVSIQATGQSGQPGSRHYADLVRPWLRGKYHPMPWARSHVRAVARHRLSLTP